MNYRKIGSTAVWDFKQMQSTSAPAVFLYDEAVFSMVDDGIEEVEFLFSDARYFTTLDDWLDRKSDDRSGRSMPLTLMDRR